MEFINASAFCGKEKPGLPLAPGNFFYQEKL